MTLREQVERILPGWECWYPSVFDAARDLGLIRARVCPPASLLLSRRHAQVVQEAEHAHREKWGGVEEDTIAATRSARKKTKKNRRRSSP